MNSKNKNLFFNESDDEIVVVTIAPGTSDEFDVEIIAAVEIISTDLGEDVVDDVFNALVEELAQEYVAVLPIEPTEDMPEDELILLKYSEDEDGNPEFEGITDDEELESVASAFEQYFDQATNELYNDDDYLNDIGNYISNTKIR